MNSRHPAVLVALTTLFATSALPRLAAQTPPATDKKDELVQLSPFEVRDTSNSPSYRATEAIAGAGLSLPIRQSPVPIDVITSAYLEDRGAFDLLSASYLVSGLVTGGPVLNGQENWRLHGYAAPALRDGFRLDNDTTNAAEIERIEVASGPAAVLYGSGATGGAVNVITKKPKFIQQGKVIAGLGTYDYHLGQIDVTGPIPGLLNDGGKPALAYRAIVSTNYSKSDIDWYKMTRNELNGSLRWQPTSRANFTVEVGSNQRHGRLALEIPEGTDKGGAIDFNKDSTGRGYQFSIAGPDTYNKMRGDNILATGDITLTDSLLLRLEYTDHTSVLQGLRSRNIQNFALGRPAQLERTEERVDQRLWKANLLWDLKAGEISNKLVVGAEGSRDHNPAIVQRTNWTVPPDFGVTPAVLSSILAAPLNTNRNRTTYFRAYRASDFANLLNNKLHVLASVRRDEATNQKDTVAKSYVSLDGATTGQIGAVYDVTPAVSPFVNWSSDFVPNTQVGPAGNVLDPQRGKGIEVGVKFGLIRDQLTGSVSWFNEKRTNIPIRIGQTSTFELSGEDRSRGVDFTFDFTPMPAWSFKFGGSFFDAKTISNKADPTQVGLAPQDVCPASLNGQITYRGQGDWKGFSAGIGGYWHNDYPTEQATNKRHERTDDVTILDAFARYAWKMGAHQAAFTVNVSNLTDKRAYIINQEAFGLPRVIRATVSYEF